MPDEIDIIQEREDNRREGLIAIAREKAVIPEGTKGECDNCGVLSLRLVGGWCARCRDAEEKGR